MIAHDFAGLSTERLTLRMLRQPDAPALLALYADPDVMRHWIHPPWTTLEQARAAIEEAHADLAAGRALHLAIVSRSDDRLAGSCALFDIVAAHRRASIGYLLARQYWGQGLGREVLQAVLDHGVDRLGLQRIEAEVAPHNDASQSLLARVGFCREGRMRARWCVAGATRDVDLWAYTPTCRPCRDSLCGFYA